MKIINQYPISIGHRSDQILFRMCLFNQGKYDKEQLRTIVRNTGLRLEITNQSLVPIEINDIALGICQKKKLIMYYHSSQLQCDLPLILKPAHSYKVNFYGAEISDKLKQYCDETGIFILNPRGKTPIISSDFDGDEVEKIFAVLTDDEIANWGSIGFKRLDIKKAAT